MIKVNDTITTRSSGLTGKVTEVVEFTCKDGRKITRVKIVLPSGTTKWSTL